MKEIDLKNLKSRRKGLKGMTAKLVISFTSLIIVSFLIIGLFSTTIAKNALITEEEISLLELAEEAARYTASNMDTQRRTLEIIALQDEIQDMDWSTQQPVLQRQLAKTDFVEMGVLKPDGSIFYSSGQTIKVDASDPSMAALKGDTKALNLGISPVTGEVVLMYATPIEKDGQIVGALIGRRDGLTLSEITAETGFGEQGYGFVVDSKGTVIAHPMQEKVISQFNPIEASKEDYNLSSLASVISNALSNKVGVEKYEFEGNNLYSGFAPIQGTDWIFIITANQEEVLAAIPKLQNAISILMVVMLLVSIPIAIAIGKSFTRPVIEMIQHSELLASLDLTQDVSDKFLKKQDEIGDLANALEKITKGMRNIINEINLSGDQVFSTKPGEVTAIIGGTGSGKSTLINLIPRFYDITGGSIKLNGVNIRNLAIEDLRKRIGLVPQKAFLFSGTIAENIRFGKEDATDEEVLHALEIAQAMEFICEKEEGIDFKIAQGGNNVSGGQRQRLAIARALVRKPEVYIFDDSFSALDFKTDAKLRKSLEEEIEDASMIVVAQRVSSIVNADRIIVLNEGNIVGLGTHKELLESCEVYKEIVLSQLTETEVA